MYQTMQRIIRKTCVFALCGQGFTRKPSAQRHNINLHDGRAEIVRPFDYLNGMLKGTFPSPADPLEWTGRRRINEIY